MRHGRQGVKGPEYFWEITLMLNSKIAPSANNTEVYRVHLNSLNKVSPDVR